MFIINQYEYTCAVNGFGIGSIWHQSECNCARAVQIRDNCSFVAKEMVEQCPFKDSAGWGEEPPAGCIQNARMHSPPSA
jgi:hypothetical protein